MKFLRWFFGKLKRPKSYPEINWPLGQEEYLRKKWLNAGIQRGFQPIAMCTRATECTLGQSNIHFAWDQCLVLVTRYNSLGNTYVLVSVLL